MLFLNISALCNSQNENNKILNRLLRQFRCVDWKLRCDQATKEKHPSTAASLKETNCGTENQKTRRRKKKKKFVKTVKEKSMKRKIKKLENGCEIFSNALICFRNTLFISIENDMF